MRALAIIGGVPIHLTDTAGLWDARAYERMRGKRALERRLESYRAQFGAYRTWAEAEFKPALPAARLCLRLVGGLRGAVQELQACGAATCAGKAHACFCRSDPRFANVIRRPDGRLAMVDWEDSGLHDPACELADVMTHPYQEDLLTDEGWRPLVEPYLAAQSARDPGLARRVELYLALFPAHWLAVSIRRGIQAGKAGGTIGWVSHGMSFNQRLRRYLARGLAWPERDYSRELASLSGLVFFAED